MPACRRRKATPAWTAPGSCASIKAPIPAPDARTRNLAPTFRYQPCRRPTRGALSRLGLHRAEETAQILFAHAVLHGLFKQAQGAAGTGKREFFSLGELNGLLEAAPRFRNRGSPFRCRLVVTEQVGQTMADADAVTISFGERIEKPVTLRPRRLVRWSEPLPRAAKVCKVTRSLICRTTCAVPAGSDARDIAGETAKR